ncbi:hypothetical protein BJ878DRAFT_172563 [Calycina marina]|uniref:Uncharacterized protein n=1 Tax=Calycina marina TaxID=1763456 RepID=A0A9P7Z9U6_9HELO|nr:hypothetical protein BJ878DRAFT_172563 [Calycina marina]
MAREPPITPFGSMPAQLELDAISNRIQLSLAKREELVRTWTASSAREDKIRKTDEELDAEDALLFQNQPAYLGVGCPIPENFLISEADRSKKSLQARLGKGLQASKRRDAEEKAASAKRALNYESSDDEAGRSAVGKHKKKAPLKKPAAAENPIYSQPVVDDEPLQSEKNTASSTTTLPIRSEADRKKKKNEKKKAKAKARKGAEMAKISMTSG